MQEKVRLRVWECAYCYAATVSNLLIYKTSKGRINMKWKYLRASDWCLF